MARLVVIVCVLVAIHLTMALAFRPSGRISFTPDVHKSVVRPKTARNILPKAGRTVVDPVQIALTFLADHNGPNVHYHVTNSYTTKHNGVTHVYLREEQNGLDVANAVVNVNVDRNGNIISAGDSTYRHHGFQPLPKPDPTITAPEAARKVAAKLGLPCRDTINTPIKVIGGAEHKVILPRAGLSQDEIPAKLMYVQVHETLRLVWDLVIRTEMDWFDCHVDAQDGTILSMLNYVADATYNVLELPVISPEDGKRSVTEDPTKREYSPVGWLDQGEGKQFHVTIGNNVYAQENFDGDPYDFLNNYRPDGGDKNAFSFPLDLDQKPSSYIDAAVTNLFYVNNMVHDIFYVFGFDEEAGNFQENNFKHGGESGDAVQANAQDGSGMNNANFATPPDGQRPRMRMYRFNMAPGNERDGDLENGIIVHEYGHGITNRLTGGPSNVNCLDGLLSGGMGEGWSDFFAVLLTLKADSTRDDKYPMGSYVTGDDKGIRPFPYSTHMDVDPQTYGYINKPEYQEVHQIGSVWTTILLDTFWDFVDKYGFDPDWFAGDKGKGNHMFLQDVIDGVKMQPCDPTLVEARDAILDADEANYEGENVCLIWKAFARRGLGVDATDGKSADAKESYDVPDVCTPSTPSLATVEAGLTHKA